jgi:hypothetical protein
MAQAPDTLWTRTYGEGTGNCVIETSDGGYVIAADNRPWYTGWGPSYQMPSELYLIKTNKNGDIIWTKSYGDPNIYNEGSSISQTQDGGFIIVGMTGANISKDVWIIKTDEFGDILWTKTIDGDRISWGNSIKQTQDGSYIICGCRDFSYSCSDDAVYMSMVDWLIKTDAEGDTLWTKTFHDMPNQRNEANSVQITNDEGFIIVGQNENCEDIWLIKTDESGDTLWTRTYGSYKGMDVQTTTDGGFIIVGSKISVFGYAHGFVIRTDECGDTLWTKTFKEMSTLSSIQKTNDNGFIIAGWKDLGNKDNIWLIKLNEFGDILWTKILEGSLSDFSLSLDGTNNSIQHTSDGGYIITGSTASYLNENRNILLIKVDSDVTSIKYNKNTIPVKFQLNQNYPNPFNPSTTIEFSLPKSEFVELKVFNILGKEVSTLVSNKLNQGNHTYTFDGKSLASGIYYYQLTAGTYRKVKKMILLR